MNIKLNKSHFSIIEKYLKEERPDLYQNIYLNLQSVYTDMDEDSLIDIHDWCVEKLQIVGFDENWELNEEGKVIDELIDIFYTE